VQSRAAPILADLRQALSLDDHVATTPLTDVIDAAYQRLLGVLVQQPAPVPVPTPPTTTAGDPLAGVTVRPGGATTGSAKVPAAGEERDLPADAAKQRIDEIRRAHPGAKIDVTIRWMSGPG